MLDLDNLINQNAAGYNSRVQNVLSQALGYGGPNSAGSHQTILA